MKRYFFDTSALVKLYHQEKGTEKLDQIINNESYKIIISDLSIVEMTSAFAKKVRTDEIDQKIFKIAITSFEEDITKFEVIEFDKIIKFEAIKLLKRVGIKEGLKSLDALQIATALVTSRKSKIDLVIVSDILLCKILRDEGLEGFLI